MKYRVVNGDSVSQLCQKVNHLIEWGWQPLGGVTFVLLNQPAFLQAMTKGEQYGAR